MKEGRPEGPVSLDAADLPRGLRDRVLLLDGVGSTQDEARRLAGPAPLYVVAETQSAGRGRRRRRWVSGRGGIWLTCVAPPRWRSLHVYACCASLAVLDSLEGLGVRGSIKWPNDILVDGRKVCGILTEAEFSGERLDFVLVGVGLNVNNAVEGVRGDYVPASVASVLGGPVDRGRLLAELVTRMEGLLLHGDERALLADYAGRCGTIGSRVRVDPGDGEITGVATGIGEDGSLLLDVDGRTVRVLSGDALYLR
ncbi:MAG: biotin--[acetyl-CoA-carboxylase] ligase [Nitrososphaerota archaeon]|nr:biotin--[acetyl-CoA-carboxylase] ligase [Nitrososphaerota archaeon]MDG6939941.1 biotin--[acetyl-CoA-carboxylase] ligase [Nitrososphaerota archaeon]